MVSEQDPVEVWSRSESLQHMYYYSFQSQSHHTSVPAVISDRCKATAASSLQALWLFEPFQRVSFLHLEPHTFPELTSLPLQ